MTKTKERTPSSVESDPDTKSPSIKTPISICQITRNKRTQEIETIYFRDTSEITRDDFVRLYPGSKSTTRRVRAARAILCKQTKFIDSQNSLPILDSDTHDLVVSLLLRNLSFSEVIDHASLNYRNPLPQMEFLRAQGIREFCRIFKKEDHCEKLLPGIVSEWIVERKRALKSVMEAGDENESPRSKRRNFGSTKDAVEKIPDGSEESEGDYDVSYIDRSGRRQKKSMATSSSAPLPIDSPEKVVRHSFQPKKSLQKLSSASSVQKFDTQGDGTPI